MSISLSFLVAVLCGFWFLPALWWFSPDALRDLLLVTSGCTGVVAAIFGFQLGFGVRWRRER